MMRIPVLAESEGGTRAVVAAASSQQPDDVDRGGNEQRRRAPPTTDTKRLPPKRVTSLVLLNTGHGKGKSTAAFGIMLRGVSRGWNVSVIQFIKSGKWKVGEEAIGRRLRADWWALGTGFTWNSKDMDETQARAREAWRTAKDKLASGDYEMVLLDEVTYPINYGWIAVAEVVSAVRQRPPQVNVILTGRDAPAELVEVAKTVTEMTKGQARLRPRGARQAWHRSVTGVVHMFVGCCLAPD